MAALTKNDKQYINDTAAHMQAWVADVVAALTAFGWVQTADTGQVAAGAITPPAANASAGYQIWKMADALQATAPVFMKVEYGAGISAASALGMWITVGQGSDGAGNITGTKTSRIAVQNGSVLPPNPSVVYYAGGTSWFIMCLHDDVAKASFLVSIERTKDNTGADTNEGVLFVGGAQQHDGAANQDYTVYQASPLIFSVGGSQPVSSNGYNVPPPGGPAMNSTIGSASDGTNVGVHPWSLPSRRGSENPGLNLLSYWRPDFGARSLPVVSMYGANHTYRCVGIDGASTAGLRSAGSTVAGASGDAQPMIRYE